MKPLSHFENIARFAAARRPASHPRTSSNFTPLVMTNATILQHLRTPQSDDSLLLTPAYPSYLSRIPLPPDIQFP